MSKFNAMLEIYIAMSESIGFCCRYFENQREGFFYCLVSIKMDLKFNLIFSFILLCRLLYGIEYYMPKQQDCMAEMFCNDDSRVYTLTMQHFTNIINIDWIFIPIGILYAE